MAMDTTITDITGLEDWDTMPGDGPIFEALVAEFTDRWHLVVQVAMMSHQVIKSFSSGGQTAEQSTRAMFTHMHRCGCNNQHLRAALHNFHCISNPVARDYMRLSYSIGICSSNYERRYAAHREADKLDAMFRRAMAILGQGAVDK